MLYPIFNVPTICQFKVTENNTFANLEILCKTSSEFQYQTPHESSYRKISSTEVTTKFKRDMKT